MGELEVLGHLTHEVQAFSPLSFSLMALEALHDNPRLPIFLYKTHIQHPQRTMIDTRMSTECVFVMARVMIKYVYPLQKT